ncbi:allene oxide synthase-lipoxygenase protein-like isoform X2 [Tubulanus polymorphus]|uniref:allene oxide synthase-lipoxygenase protein-like isoform X2 n=1 Tax=Tubulanus polymorphus TaxID=672921 RepID=UPI003DA306D0
MGNSLNCSTNSSSRSGYVIFVVTGDRKEAGTDANVTIKLYGEDGRETPEVELNCLWRNDFERGEKNRFFLKYMPTVGPLKMIEFWRDNFGMSPNWFVEKIVIEDCKMEDYYFFPINRWIKANQHYVIQHYDTNLPQDDSFIEQRRKELEEKRQLYTFTQNAPGLPVQIENMPDDEKFSNEYKWDIVGTKIRLLAEKTMIEISTSSEKWDTLDDLRNVYKSGIKMEEPKGVHLWSNDTRFGAQRLCGCNPVLIQLCLEIPDKLAVDEETLKPFLDGWSFQQIVAAKRLFIVDLKILEGIKCPENRALCAPIALFFVAGDKTLRPIAIQLFQKPGPDNPVFFPTDQPYVWLLAKIWYNNADATYHQCLTHLGLTHLLMEGISISTHRQISPSHPIFKLLAPHFLYLIAINSRGLEKLIAAGGWVDKTMTVGRDGMLQLIAKGFQHWRMDVDGLLPMELESRGMFEANVCPDYHYRDDGLLLFRAIKNYVSRIVGIYYASDDILKEDYEIQNWVKELVTPVSEGGVGLKGVAGNGQFTKIEDLVATLTSIIFTCSASHAMANFSQYDEYGFPLNYPGFLNGEPPRNKEPLSEEDIIHALPTKQQTLDTMVVTKLLSQQGTNALGDFEVMYMHHPPALKCVEQFRNDLKQISELIQKKNEERTFKYTLLDPAFIPNSISI